MSTTNFTFITHGNAGPAAIDYAERKLSTVARHTGATVRLMRVHLNMASDPARPRPAKAEAEVELVARGGHDTIRASAHGSTLPEAIDRLEDRLLDQLQHRAERRRTRRRGSG